MSAVYRNELAENAVVGAGLLGYPQALAELDLAADLIDPRLVATATAVLSLPAEGCPVDPVAVLARMQALPDFPWARTAEVGLFLASLASVESCPVPAQASWHLQSVRAATARRRLLAAGQRLQDWAAGELDPQALADRITTELYDLLSAVERIAPRAVVA